jgi:amylosucrase
MTPENGTLRLGPSEIDQIQVLLGSREGDAFLARLDQLRFDITEPLEQVYCGTGDLTRLVTGLILDAAAAAAERPAALRRLDYRREIDPGWFQRSRMIGYVCYADRFAGSLQGSASTWTTWLSWG